MSARIGILLTTLAWIAYSILAKQRSLVWLMGQWFTLPRRLNVLRMKTRAILPSLAEGATTPSGVVSQPGKHDLPPNAGASQHGEPLLVSWPAPPGWTTALPQTFNAGAPVVPDSSVKSIPRFWGINE